ncbi:aminotransferase class V-fold PLP-dependent enzyme [Deinococcus cavernae]|nr:SufS family cysteine desulfurase [Deinococcus cavernae]
MTFVIFRRAAQDYDGRKMSQNLISLSSPLLAGAAGLAGCRADFPVFRHHPGLVFLDSAASTQKPQQIIDAIAEFYAGGYANIHRGAYRLSAQATDQFEAVRERAAQFFKAPAAESIIFTRNATEAVNLVAYSWGLRNLNAGDVVLVSEMEHHANLVPWHLVTGLRGARVEAVRMTPEGRLDLEDYAQKLQLPNLKLVALQHISNALGTIHPAKQLVDMAHRHGKPILLDGAQAAPHMPLNLSELGADFYVLSAHKMLGPSGVGLLIAQPQHLRDMPPFLGGGDMIREVYTDRSTYADLPNRFEAGTPAIAEVVGFGAALAYLEALGMENIHAHESELFQYAQGQLNLIEGVDLYGPESSSEHSERAGVLSFNVRGAHAHDVAGFLDEANICVRAGHHCAQPLMRALDVVSTARASFYVYNTREDVDALARELRDIATFFGENL